ncbi:MAG: hypothetical protein IPN67_16690 [Bacteroidales bacterium]|nr:hypothetical protein [Bacteroidales bacterium]
MRGYDGLIETEFRMIFLYLLVYDGFLYEFSPSEADDFSLMEIEFGQYSYEYHFKPQIDYDIINQAFVKHMVEYGSHFVLEIMPHLTLINTLIKLKMWSQMLTRTLLKDGVWIGR